MDRPERQLLPRPHGKVPSNEGDRETQAPPADDRFCRPTKAGAGRDGQGQEKQKIKNTVKKNGKTA